MIMLTLQIQKEVKNDREIRRAIKALEKEGWNVNVQDETDLDEEEEE